ncbi:hypothetical protein [Piscirickettsia salmonis]|uniref:hypothetical protein n=1 Tax=Piscirickettsia salmonis TaxID=1238 RepID=UPI001EE3B33B|nr:hypothetical protein [Piscirickettsia salmonis]
MNLIFIPILLMILIMSPAISSKTENKLFSWKPEQLMNIKQISELDLSSSAPTLAYVVDFTKRTIKIFGLRRVQSKYCH